MKIAFFDSGVGGLTVLNTALKLIPHHQYLYYADCDNVPYGNKTKEEVKSIVLKAVEFIATQNIQALVIACNTATSVAINELRLLYSFPIIGMEPAVKPAVDNQDKKRILVFATEMTLKEEKFKSLVKKVDSKNVVDYLPLPELVLFAENFEFDENLITDFLKTKLAQIKLDKYETIVLGCTHFPYFINSIKKVIPQTISIIDGNLGTVKHLMRHISPCTEKMNTQIDYFVSGRPAPKEYFEKYLHYLNTSMLND